MTKQPCVYILASGRAGTIYTGVTSDLVARLYKHRAGLTPGFASKHEALRLVWYEIHAEMPSAILREKRIKKWNRDWKLNLIEQFNPLWVDLAIDLGFEPVVRSPETDSPSRGNDEGMR